MIQPFYIGQRIVAIATTDTWKKGQEFTVIGIKKSCCTNKWLVNIGGGYETRCEVCRKTDGPWFFHTCFAPLEHFGEFVSMKMVAEKSLELIGAN